MLRYGIAGDDAPRTVEPSVYGKDERGSLTTFGDAAVFNSREPERLVEDSVIRDIDGIQFIGSHINDSLGLAPTGVLYSLNLAVPLTGKLALLESHFELTGQATTSLTSSACLSMYSTGRTTGLSLNLGHDGCEIGGLFEGSIIGRYSRFSPFSGRQVSETLFSALQQAYPELFDKPSFRKMAVVEDIKQKSCRVTAELQAAEPEPRLYEMPDGEVIEVSPAAARAPDLYFEPAAFGLACKSLAQLVESSLNSEVSDHAVEDLNSTLVLTGGPSMHPNLPERLDESIQQSTCFRRKIRLTASMERKYSSWIGGSILASLSSFGNIVVSRASFEEQGAYRVYRKSCATTFC